MRTLTTSLLWLVTTLATTVAIGSGWTAWHLQREDGFVALASAAGNDPQVQRAAADLAGEAFVEQVRVPDFLRDRVESAVTEAVVRITSSDGWEDAWQETVRRSHQELFATPTPSTVQLDVTPLVDLALQEFTSALPIDLSAPDQLSVPISQEDPGPSVAAVERSTTVAVIAIGIAVAAGLLALVVSRRRSTTFAMLGGGLLLASGGWWLAGREGLPRYLERLGVQSDSAGTLRDVLVDRVVGSLDSTLVWVAVAGGAMVLVGLVSRAANRA